MVNVEVEDHFAAFVLCVHKVSPYPIEPKIVPVDALADQNLFFLFQRLCFKKLVRVILVVVLKQEVDLISIHLVELQRTRLYETEITILSFG